MKIMIVHNRYQQPGGEDAVVASEGALLLRHGQDVVHYERNNAELASYSLAAKVRHLSSLQGSQPAYRDMKESLNAVRPDIVHVHNIFYMLTPAVYAACREAGIPVVQSLHNFRLLCANALFLRNNRPCEMCQQRGSLWWGVVHRCYRHSRLLSASVVGMVAPHWHRGTWQARIQRYIATSEFSRHKFVLAGIPPHKIVVKPNFVDEHAAMRESVRPAAHALYVGRLSAEKGVQVLLRAWKEVPSLPLKIVGDGPLRPELQAYIERKGLRNVELVGHVDDPDVLYRRYMVPARLVIVPSICYENFPRVIAEAYACGIPVIASRRGSLPELVDEGVTGWLFEPAQPRALAHKVNWCLANPGFVQAMQEAVRKKYEAAYSAEENWRQLQAIYREVVEESRGQLQ